MKEDNFYKKYDWQTMMSLNPYDEYNTQKYHQILSPVWPDFLDKYIALPVMQRLKGIGLLCGTDWTTLYKNRFYYSRFDHSVGVALIIWHFTNDKAQTIAGLLHDVSTPVFSHVSDFRKGDALTQTATEAPNESIIRNDKKLLKLLQQDGLSINQVEDYHKYPIADNEIPQLSADRLEYMFPSGMALDGSWNLADIKKAYDDIIVLENEDGEPELGFKTLETAEDYCRRFCMIGHILQLNENKLTLDLLGKIMNMAVELNILQESDFMTKSEAQIIEEIEKNLGRSKIFAQYYKTFRTMTKIEHTNQPKNPEEYFCVNLKVKQRYINPLVQKTAFSKKAVRLSKVSAPAKKYIEDFLDYSDTEFGCVLLQNE